MPKVLGHLSLNWNIEDMKHTRDENVKTMNYANHFWLGGKREHTYKRLEKMKCGVFYKWELLRPINLKNLSVL